MTGTYISLDELLAENGPLADVIDGYEVRPGQLEMAAVFLDALNRSSGRAIVEGGTGTGKSLAYLSAALLFGKQVIISTKTKALQDQLGERDLPALVRAAELAGLPEKRFAVMKGRQNYLCLHRFDAFKAQPTFSFHEESAVYDDLVKWSAETEHGDRDELKVLPDRYATWSEIDAGAETCLGTRCSQYESCFVTQMRRRAAAADIIVVNHHLLAADLRVRLESSREDDEERDEEDRGFASVLPPADAVIIDEAHALPDVASEHMAVTLSGTKLDRLARDLQRVAQKLEAPQRLALLGALERAQASAREVFDKAGGGRHRTHIKSLDVDDETEVVRASLDAAAGLVTRGEHSDQVKAERDALARRCTGLGEDLRFIAHEAVKDNEWVVYSSGDAQLAAAPAEPDRVLEKTLFDTDRSVVMTSATLLEGNDASGFQSRTGAKDASVHRFPSPFPYEARAALYCPAQLALPNNARWHDDVHDELKFLLELSSGGAMCLFTSHRALRTQSERLAPHLDSLGIRCLVQGDAPKRALLDQLRESNQAALFATHTFWEGVDVKGPALRMVIIDRLPFKPPDDPMSAARGDRLRAAGGDPFSELSVPEATLALKQGVGRLMRAADDAGVVAILDARLRKRPFGRRMLDALPPMMRIGSRAGVEKFWSARVVPALELE